jgi:NAD(P) transhydrogenase subunit alpha
MKIGIPRETAAGETRVAATPDTVKKLLSLNAEVCVEHGAGESAHFLDADYQNVGAQLVDTAQALAADVVFKVRKPSSTEIDAISPAATLVGFMEPYETDGTLEALAERGVNALAVERIPRISRSQSMDALSSQANIAGYRAVLEASIHYGRFLPMMMTAAGSARPARFVVLGAGVAGLQAIATARRLGAEVEAFDVRPEVKEQIESLGAKFIELDVGESGSGEGGYAKELSAEGKQRQQVALGNYLAKANIIVTTALIPGRAAPVLVTEEALKGMSAGSVVVDMAAANGGNCPLTEVDQVVVRDGVILVGHSNYPALVPGDSSAFYARNLFNLMSLLIDETGLKPFAEDEITQASLVTNDGKVIV